MKYRILLYLVAPLLLPFFSFAATSDFTIKTTIINDLNPPTTPTLLSVTPIASTQIDVTWSTSTDDYLMGGYVLLRDGIPRATTTLTNFSDSGLTASTTYSYEVYAFDWDFNISTTSNALATTTLEAPIVPTSTEPVASSSNPANVSQTIVLRSILVETETNSAKLSWQTNIPSRYILRWGRTDSYDNGYVVNESYQSSHITDVTGLEPGTTYLYELIGTSPAGINVVLKKGQFKTESERNTYVIENVKRLEAEVLGSDVKLTWQIPEGNNVAKIRIVRNYLGFPIDVYDGAVVYEGLGNDYLDKGALGTNSPQYYTVFVIGLDGTISSGAIVVVYKNKEIQNENDPSGVTGSSSGSVVPATPDMPLFGLDTNNINLVQGDSHFTFLSDRIALSYRKPFTISIPFDALPKHLKAIIVTLLDPTDQRKSYSFLLRINKDGDAYEATVAPLNVLGISRLQVEIFDLERMLVGKYQKQVDFVTDKSVETKVIFPDAFISPWLTLVNFGWPWLLPVIPLSLFLFWRRRKKDEDKN